MSLLKRLLRVAVDFLFWFLVAYWAIFVFCSIYYLLEGGPDRVLHWYMHTSGAMQIQSVSNGVAVARLTPWRPMRFVANQVAILVVTLALYFLGRRLRESQR